MKSIMKNNWKKAMLEDHEVKNPLLIEAPVSLTNQSVPVKGAL